MQLCIQYTKMDWKEKLENSKRTKQQSNSKSKNKVWTSQNNTDQGQYTAGRCIISDRVCQPDGWNRQRTTRTIHRIPENMEQHNHGIPTMDSYDVVLIHHDKEEIQKMLDITDEIAKRYHIKFGKEKSQILTIGNTEETPNFKLGDETIDPTTTYKYLGMTVNRKGNLETHLNAVKGKVEAALQTIFCIAGNEEFRIIDMATIWKLVTHV